MRLNFLLVFVAFCSLAQAQDTNAPVGASTSPPPATPSGIGSPAPAGGATDAATQAKANAVLAMLRDANQMLTKGDSNGALAKVNAALQTDPRSVAAYAMRGAIDSQKSMWAQAANDFESAHMLAPNNDLINFNLAETKFAQKQYDAARPGFAAIAVRKGTDVGDLASYKVFLCDLFGNHMDVAQKELDAFNQVGSGASYYYANAAWDLAHHQIEDARGWLTSASTIYSSQKNGFYLKSLSDHGYFPLPPAPAQ